MPERESETNECSLSVTSLMTRETPFGRKDIDRNDSSVIRTGACRYISMTAIFEKG